MSIIDENILCAPLCNPLRAFVVSFCHKGTQSTHEGARSLKERLKILYKIDSHHVN